ncbi:MAG TPA: hypothetical protein VNX01_09090 [Bacteroidia bacterium]|jgi:hypothetical protein|nr:hypothetical protein [Bacteroidia bacterium]
METTSFSKIAHTFDENIQTSDKWFKEINSEIMDIYKKQLSLVFDFYNDAFANQFKALHSQAMRFNTDWVAEFQKQFQNIQVNWNKLNGKSQEIMGEKWEITDNIMASMIEAHNKRVDFSIELNKKLIEEINNQLRLAVVQNEKFCSDFLKRYEIFDKTENKQEQFKKQEKANQFTANN